MTPVLPGDFGLTRESGPGGAAITVAEWLDEVAQGRWSKAARAATFDHAFLVEAVDPDGTVHAIEAWPGGARRNTYRVDAPGMLWSSGHFNLTDTERAAIVTWAQAHLGTKYSFLDYAVQAAVRLHVPFAAQWLTHRVVATGHLLCSQYVDAAWQAAGYHLFADGRAPYDVAPSDLADLLN